MTSGVVPRIGLEHIAVGRTNEIKALLNDLDAIAAGGAAFRFIVGRYGSGKSFLIQLIRNRAMDLGFAVADADLSPEKRLTGSANQGLNTYRELLGRMATKARPDGGAMESLLQKWISSIKAEIISSGISTTDQAIELRLEGRILETINSAEELAHGFDFALVLSAYYRAFAHGDDEKRQAALKWLRGEYGTKMEAKRELKVGEIINDANWYDYLKLFSFFLTKIGYKGLIVFFDECAILDKLPSSKSREANYEKILALFNDTMQGKAQNLGIYMSGTPEFIEDERRGVFSYAALKSRLSASKYARSGLTDWNAPIIILSQLTVEEIFVLLERLCDVHAQNYGYEKNLTDEQLTTFLQIAKNQMGAQELLTPREITRDFLGLLNLLNQYSDSTFESIVGNGYSIKAYSGDEGDAVVSDEYASFEL
jgi:hypothetical protein